MEAKCKSKAKMRMDDSAGPIIKSRGKKVKGNAVKSGGKIFGSKRSMRSVKSA